MPNENEDNEEHTKRVCSVLYNYMTDPCKSCIIYSKHEKINGEYCKTCFQNPKRLDKAEARRL